LSLHHWMYMTDGVGFDAISAASERRAVTASVIFWIPFVRDLVLWIGGIDASREVVDKALQEGKSLTIMVGGEREQLMARPGHHVAFASSRKGFIQLALKHGVPIVPAWCFGEGDLYTTSQFLEAARMLLVKKLGIALPLAWGPSWLFPLKPHKKPVVTVLGKPIPMPKVELDGRGKPPAAVVDAIQSKYFEALTGIFNKHKAQYGYPEATLKIM